MTIRSFRPPSRSEAMAIQKVQELMVKPGGDAEVLKLYDQINDYLGKRGAHRPKDFPADMDDYEIFNYMVILKRRWPRVFRQAAGENS